MSDSDDILPDEGMHESDAAFLASLLASASTDEAPATAKAATLASLGLATTTVVGATAAAVAAKAFSAKFVTVIAGVALLAGALVGSVATIALAPAYGNTAAEGALGRRGEGAPVSAQPPAAGQPLMPLSSTEPSAGAVREPDTLPPAAAGRRHVTNPAVDVPAPSATGAASAVPPSTSRTSLARETALLSEVREAIQAHDPGTAKARLAAYDNEFPQGLLRTEARVLQSRLEGSP